MSLYYANYLFVIFITNVILSELLFYIITILIISQSKVNLLYRSFYINYCIIYLKSNRKILLIILFNTVSTCVINEVFYIRLSVENTIYIIYIESKSDHK